MGHFSRFGAHLIPDHVSRFDPKYPTLVARTPGCSDTATPRLSVTVKTAAAPSSALDDKGAKREQKGDKREPHVSVAGSAA